MPKKKKNTSGFSANEPEAEAVSQPITERLIKENMEEHDKNLKECE